MITKVILSTFRIILGKHYTRYENALEKLNRKTLNKQRHNLRLNFEKKGLKIKAMQKLFPKYTNSNNKHNMMT